MSRRGFWTVLAGAGAALAVIAVAALALTGGDDDKTRSTAAQPASRTPAAAGDGLPEFALNFPKTWRRVAASAAEGEPPRAVIQRKDRSGIITMTINGPVKQSLKALEADMRAELRDRYPGLRQLRFERIKAEAGDGLLSTWIGPKGRVQSNLVVPSGKVSYSLDAVVVPGEEQAATEVGEIYAAFDAKPVR